MGLSLSNRLWAMFTLSTDSFCAGAKPIPDRTYVHTQELSAFGAVSIDYE